MAVEIMQAPVPDKYRTKAGGAKWQYKRYVNAIENIHKSLLNDDPANRRYWQDKLWEYHTMGPDQFY